MKFSKAESAKKGAEKGKAMSKGVKKTCQGKVRVREEPGGGTKSKSKVSPIRARENFNGGPGRNSKKSWGSGKLSDKKCNRRMKTSSWVKMEVTQKWEGN